MREGPQLRVAKAARAPPCTLPILAQAPTLRLSHGHTSMTAAFALTGCGRRLPHIKLLISEIKCLFQFKEVCCGNKRSFYYPFKKSSASPASSTQRLHGMTLFGRISAHLVYPCAPRLKKSSMASAWSGCIILAA